MLLQRSCMKDYTFCGELHSLDVLVRNMEAGRRGFPTKQAGLSMLHNLVLAVFIVSMPDSSAND